MGFAIESCVWAPMFVQKKVENHMHGVNLYLRSAQLQTVEAQAVNLVGKCMHSQVLSRVAHGIYFSCLKLEL